MIVPGILPVSISIGTSHPEPGFLELFLHRFRRRIDDDPVARCATIVTRS